MRRSSYEQFAIVSADSASLFTELLNGEVYRLRDNHPVVHFSESIPFYAQVKYVVNEDIPESISDAYELEGCRFVCSQCPYYEPILTKEGEVDKRRAYGDCEFAEYGRTGKTTPACDKLYELIKEREVTLCFTK